MLGLHEYVSVNILYVRRVFLKPETLDFYFTLIWLITQEAAFSCCCCENFRFYIEKKEILKEWQHISHQVQHVKDSNVILFIKRK
jgi:hypothetical protein